MKKPYNNTKVHYMKSQEQISKLLNNNGIKDIQHTAYQDKINIMFIKELKVEGKGYRVGVKITIPQVTEKAKNQLYRCLFYYLKSKFESLMFGFVEEYNEAFAKEFMPYLITDKHGNTVADIILPKLGKALEYTKAGEQLYLEDSHELEKDN